MLSWKESTIFPENQKRSSLWRNDACWFNSRSSYLSQEFLVLVMTKLNDRWNSCRRCPFSKFILPKSGTKVSEMVNTLIWFKHLSITLAKLLEELVWQHLSWLKPTLQTQPTETKWKCLPLTKTNLTVFRQIFFKTQRNMKCYSLETSLKKLIQGEAQKD